MQRLVIAAQISTNTYTNDVDAAANNFRAWTP
jgi:hypothetical protein